MSEESHHRADRDRALVKGVRLGGICALMACELIIATGPPEVIRADPRVLAACF